MKQADIHVGGTYARRELSPRKVMSKRSVNGSRPYVFYLDSYGIGGCYLSSFAAWADREIDREI